jgi:hypothetical protein
MRNITKVLLATSLTFVLAILTFTFTYDMAVSYSANVEEKEVEKPEEVEEPVKKVEEPEEAKEEEESNSKVLFYSGMFLLIILVGAMLVIFLAKIEE